MRRAVVLLLAAVSIFAVERLTIAQHPVVRMLAIIATTFVAMKIVVLVFANAALSFGATLEFFGWFGMRPNVFEKERVGDRASARDLAVSGLRTFACGALLFAVARFVAGVSPATAIVLALPALSLMLHFGFFDVVTAFYRRRGIPVGELFHAPLRAQSLSDFWSRRWNTGFSEMIAIVVDRPLRGVLGATPALYASFLASGLLHELAISVPVRAGYGLPTLYFLLHGTLVAIERKLGRTPGRAWTLFWLAAPLPLLFHPWFVRAVVKPLVLG